ncbi:hypothetical protein HaLaN_13368, partial [Haematococcus lacustris]
MPSPLHPSLAAPSLYDKLKDDIINLAPPLLLQAKGPLADWVMRKAATGLLPSSSLADCKGALAKLAQGAGEPGWSGSGAVGQLPSAEVLAKLGVVVHGWRQQEAQEEAQAADLRVLKGVLEGEASGGGAVGGRGGAGRGSGALELSAWQPSQEEIDAGEPRTPRLTTAAVERRVQQVGQQ